MGHPIPAATAPVFLSAVAAGCIFFFIHLPLNETAKCAIFAGMKLNRI